MLNKKLPIILLSLFATTAVAEPEHREHGKHQHGVAELSIALSQQEIEIELQTPAYNVLGFEHAPSTEQQQQHVTTQFATLKQPANLFAWNTACELEKVEIESPFEDDDHHDEDEHKHHGHHDEGEHKHHGHHNEGEYKHHGHHDEDEHSETHSDIEVMYHYHCQSLPTSLDTKGLFTQFPNFETINLQWVNDNQQSAQALTAGSAQVKFD
ncbi:DUF2796 domain-containing protein [Candidatus Albibeggiatoa sp. nov. NOAA]|uniref:ZrgA family zinc uptake protein n=1 Tax=Candidatus Albibeggiatoa sp. nov. NOAA TaxID=3162724 RepID=UPI0032FFB302|nr:DUF2796 domain-containing protein [Thiotrichaceae bacterium]